MLNYINRVSVGIKGIYKTGEIKLLMKNILKKVLLIVAICYVAVIFIEQQNKLNSYHSAQEYNEQKLQEAQEYKESLIAMQENINSSEYIEQIARDKLYMYLPNEKVYIDRSKQ